MPLWFREWLGSRKTVVVFLWRAFWGTMTRARHHWSFRGLTYSNFSHHLLEPGCFEDVLSLQTAFFELGLPLLWSTSNQKHYYSKTVKCRKISSLIYLVLELTVSPFGKMRDLTRSQMFSRTRSSICWNNGTWNNNQVRDLQRKWMLCWYLMVLKSCVCPKRHHFRFTEL